MKSFSSSSLTLLLLVLLATSAAAKKETKEVNKEPEKLHAAEIAHRKNMRFFFSIGEGFEGTASDWTEYVVWLIGVCGVFFYMANPNARRNLHAMEDDEPTRHEQEPQYEADGDDLFAAGTSPNGRAETSPGGNGQRPHYD